MSENTGVDWCRTSSTMSQISLLGNSEAWRRDCAVGNLFVNLLECSLVAAKLTRSSHTIFIIWSIFIQFVMLSYCRGKAHSPTIKAENWNEKGRSAVLRLVLGVLGSHPTINNIICRINKAGISGHDTRRARSGDRNMQLDTVRVFSCSDNEKLFRREKGKSEKLAFPRRERKALRLLCDTRRRLIRQMLLSKEKIFWNATLSSAACVERHKAKGQRWLFCRA